MEKFLFIVVAQWTRLLFHLTICKFLIKCYAKCCAQICFIIKQKKKFVLTRESVCDVDHQTNGKTHVNESNFNCKSEKRKQRRRGRFQKNEKQQLNWALDLCVHLKSVNFRNQTERDGSTKALLLQLTWLHDSWRKRFASISCCRRSSWSSTMTRALQMDLN